MKRNKKDYLDIIDKYAQIIASMPTVIDNSTETLHEIATKVNISNSALSNKKHGRRDWKHEDIEKLIEVLGTKGQQEIVKNYLFVVQDILPIIKESGYRHGFIFEKAGLTVGQYQVRNRSVATWGVSEVKRIIDVLKF